MKASKEKQNVIIEMTLDEAISVSVYLTECLYKIENRVTDHLCDEIDRIISDCNGNE